VTTWMAVVTLGSTITPREESSSWTGWDSPSLSRCVTIISCVRAICRNERLSNSYGC
jgi:hypothetical protein